VQLPRANTVVLRYKLIANILDVCIYECYKLLL